MAYLDPMRFALSGDPVRARQHVRTARVAALGLVQLNAEGGVESGRRRLNLADGTVIEVVHAGQQVSAAIRAPGGQPPVEVTIAFVSALVDTVPKIYIADVDAQRVVQTLTFNTLAGSPIAALVAHPKGRWLYALFGFDLLVKIDLLHNTATGLSLGITPSFIVDMFCSPDGARLHLRYAATGIPGGDYFYGGVLTLSSDDFSLLAQHPATLFSNRQYRGCVHPKRPELLYLPAFGDADDDEDPHTGDSDPDAVPESVRVYDYSGGPTVHADKVWDYYVPSSFGLAELTIDKQGAHAYLVSTRAASFPPSGGAAVPVPTLFVYDVTDGALVRSADLLTGVELAGNVAVGRTGRRIFAPEASTGLTRVLQRTDSGLVERTPFEYASVGDAPAAGRRALPGPDRDKHPDPRVHFLGAAAGTLKAFPEAGSTPSHTVTFPTPVGTFALGWARRSEAA